MIGAALIENGPHKTELSILTRTPILRQKDLMSEREADTVAKRLYVALLRMYTQPNGDAAFHDIYVILLRKIISMPLEKGGFELVSEIAKLVMAKDHYRALKVCRKLIELESKGTGQ